MLLLFNQGKSFLHWCSMWYIIEWFAYKVAASISFTISARMAFLYFFPGGTKVLVDAFCTGMPLFCLVLAILVWKTIAKGEKSRSWETQKVKRNLSKNLYNFNAHLLFTSSKHWWIFVGLILAEVAHFNGTYLR